MRSLAPGSSGRLAWFGQFLREELAPYPGRAAVVARNRFAVELRGHERIVIERVFDSDIGGIAIVAAKENVAHFRFRFHNFR